MRNCIPAVLGFLTACFVVISCRDASNREQTGKQSERINISVDETFKPVIEQQIKVFESSWPQTDIVASYKSEADCFRDLQKDSTRMIIVARGLNGEENKFFSGKLNYRVPYELL